VLARHNRATQKVREFAGLLRLVRKRRPQTVLEIGTMHGGSLWAWCQVAARDATIISVDLPGGPFGGGYDDPERLRGYARPEQSLHLIQGDSHSPETLAKVEDLLAERRLHFAFIDADHSYEGVRRDFEMYGPLVSGLVAFHDILPDDPATGCEVERLWRELRPKYRAVEFTDVREAQREGAWGIGVLYMP
jgi:cephalosporin hydroxylase